MVSVASITAKGAAMPPQISLSRFGQIDAAALLGPSYSTMREAFGLHQPLHGYAENSFAAAAKLLGNPLSSSAFFGQIDSTVKQLASQQSSIASAAGTAIGALVEREAHGLAGMSDAIFASGIGRATTAIKMVAESQAALTDIDSGLAHWADSFTRMPQNIARLGTIVSYPIPAIHIRRAPASLPLEDEDLSIAPERCTRHLGRPRGSYQCSPELVISTYKRLAESGRYVTQGRLAEELGIELRTLQNYLSPRRMGLGWPLKL